jgi:centrosomal protein CEP104
MRCCYVVQSSGHSNADVRLAAKQVTQEVYLHAGAEAVEPFIQDLRKKQREEYEIAFEEVGGGGEGGKGAQHAAAPRDSDGGGGGGGSGAAEAGARGGADGPGGGSHAPPMRASPGRGRDGKVGEGGADMMGDEGDEDDGDDQPFTCHFCGRYDERFTPNNLDLHYWQECPMLVNCPGCGQVKACLL